MSEWHRKGRTRRREMKDRRGVGGEGGRGGMQCRGVHAMIECASLMAGR